jgi:hypothetical protein
MSVPNHWLLGWWYPRRLRVHQQRYRHGDSNENVCSTKTTTWLHTMPYSIIYHCKFKRSLNNYLIIKIMSLEEKRQMQLHCIYIIHPGYRGVRVTRFLSFVHLTIVLFVLLWFAKFDYSFGIFKLFLQISRDNNYIVFSDDSVEMLDI